MNKLSRSTEYKVLLYRIFLAYVFYFVARILFYAFNSDLIKLDGLSDFFELAFYGLAFDTTAILYVNSLFILLSILPLTINTTQRYQRILFYIYFITNLIAYATNYVDFIYYKFIYSRTTTSVMGSLENETNKLTLLSSFIVDYWYVLILFIFVSALWVYGYKKINITPTSIPKKLAYYSTSIIGICIIGTLSIGGIRGDFKHSTRPINIVDSSRHVKNIAYADIVLNTPFSIIRTIGHNFFKKVNYVEGAVIQKEIKPIKQYSDSLLLEKPNVVIFIIESYGKEYLGAFNKNNDIKDYVSYTPFIDSLAQHSLVFSNAFANGRKSIHGMSSVLAGIPSFKTAFTSSAYSKQPIQSLVSAYNEMGYDTSFFHGAPNGSMGFLGFGNILGFNYYYGKTEFEELFPNQDEFDGIWGIWDEPFLQFMNQTISKKTEPFMSTVFTVSSHSPFIIPEKYNGKFPEGYLPMHKCVGYTDYAIKKFFEAAKKEPWFENTIFVFTADHGNQTQHEEYKKPINRLAVPLMFYYPKKTAVLTGENTELAQQIDIYPTLLNLSGYNKPFRSWGRSLVSDTLIKPYVMSHSGKFYQFMQNDYICVFDGEKSIGFYDINDKALKNNLIDKKNEKMIAVEDACKAFIQDYMERIIDRKMTAN